jgi:hypothetical protein
VRILVVSNQDAPVVGGIEVLLRELCPAFVARIHEVEALTSTLPHRAISTRCTMPTTAGRRTAPRRCSQR